MPAESLVGTTSLKIVGSRQLRKYAVIIWETAKVIVAGEYRKNDNKIYMAMTSGTTDGTGPNSPPIHPDGDADDGGVVWRRVPDGKRNSVSVVNNSGVRIYEATNNAAVINAGKRLNANGGSDNFKNREFQGEISVIAASGSGNSVTHEEG